MENEGKKGNGIKYMEKISLSDMMSQISLALDAVETDLVGATPYHSKRVAVLCLAIGRHLGYDETRLFALAGCALLHDNALTEYILSEKPGKGKELNLKAHCSIGEENAVAFPFPCPVEGFVLYHHETIDGKGAFGKKENEFPEEAEIIGLADKVDVTLHLQKLGRNGAEKAAAYIRKLMGIKYSEKICRAALAVLDEKLLDSLADALIYDTLRLGMPRLVEWISEENLIGISGIIARIIDYKSNFTKLHSVQIANKAWFMGESYHYSYREKVLLYVAAAFHDVGKLFVPIDILEKPGALTDEEFATIKSHVEWTWKVLSEIQGFEKIAVWASNHHEKLNGSGYPLGRKTDELDFNSRLLTCLDIYQAVREARPYHIERSHEDTMKVLYQMAGAGVTDLAITKDLDRELVKLDKGVAPAPVGI